MLVGKAIGEVHVERQVLCLCDVAEVAADGFAQGGERNILDIDGDSAGFDLGEIQNVVDQVQQVRA